MQVEQNIGKYMSYQTPHRCGGRQKLKIEDFIQAASIYFINPDHSKAVASKTKPQGQNKVFSPKNLKSSLVESKKMNLSSSRISNLSTPKVKPNLKNIVRSVKKEFASVNKS
jgi:hypothetical protein